MNFIKNLKMGAKMALGFGLVIILVLIVGGTAVINLIQIQNDSTRLKDEYVPEVAIANEVERSSLSTMYAMRGYSLSFNDSYLKEGRDHLKDVMTHLNEAKEHAEKFPKLTALKTGTAQALIEAQLYSDLADETVITINHILANRAIGDEAASSFMGHSTDYLRGQENKIREDLNNQAGEAAILERVNKITWINEVIDLGNALRVANFKGQLFNDTQGMNEALTSFAEFKNVLEKMRKITSQQDDLDDLSDILLAGNEYATAMTDIIGDYKTLAKLNTDRGLAADKVLEASQNVSKVGISTTEEIAAGAVERVVSSVTIVLIGLIVALILAIIIAVVLTNVITKALVKGLLFANELSVGNLSATLDVDQKDELGQLAAALVEMRNKLTEVVSVVLTGSEQIATASEQLSSGNQDLSNRTEQQATALEETSSAIEEMNSSIRSNADNTASADQLSKDALEKTDEGSKAVSSMIISMNEINASSTRIADIIEVINNIAFQTNLLALNASIEAARAGEQGKGFAVVAVEVRKLAKRSDKAAAEIAAIIKTSNIKVNEGVDIANKAGETLTEINNSVKKVTALVGEISAASQEQLSSVDQIDKTLSSLDENTQKNASLVEEAASSTEELSAQAQELNTNMQFFKLDRTSGSRKPINTKSQKRSTGVALVEDKRPVKKQIETKTSGNSQVYETFSNMADESDFAEF